MLADLDALAAIGGLPNGGVDRLAWSTADVEGRAWFAERIRQAGLEPRRDSALNVFGHVAGAPGPFLLTGSHLDSVPNGGRLDGAYGAVAALEVLRTLAEHGDPAADRVEIVGFSDEEGVRFSIGLLGSLALCGELALDRLRAAKDLEGAPIETVLEQAGTHVERLIEAHDHLSSVAAFLELHVEQGPRMEADAVELAVVTGIVGVYRQQVRILGVQNHAGTTPFRLRRDAGQAAAAASSGLRRLVQAVNDEAVANIGVMRFSPGGINIVPGEATFTLEIRHAKEGVVREILNAFTRRLDQVCREEGCESSVELLSWVPPAPMDPRQMRIIEAACHDLGTPPARLWSGAGHDAAVLSRHVPTGMVFVPSVGGISHAPEEATADNQLVLGARALLRAVRTAATQIK